MSDGSSYRRCFDPRFLAAILGAAVVAVVAAGLGRRFPLLSAPRLALAGVQALAMGGTIVAVVLRLGHLDEMERRIQYESLAIAFALSAASIQCWGFFEKAGLPRCDWGAWAWPFMALIWGGAFVLVRRRYR